VTLTLDPWRTTGANLWRERKLGRPLFLSDELHGAMKKEGIKFFPLVRTKELPLN
jgi:hypothetical protein